MNVQEYVLRQLDEYQRRVQSIQALEFELHALAPLTEKENDALIASMTFASPIGERVQTSTHADKTANIALSYRETGFEQLKEVMQNLLRRINHFQLENKRLDLYLSTLTPEDEEIIKMHYFQRLSWRRIAEQKSICLRTVMKRKDRGIARLVELYGSWAELGGLPEVNDP